MARNFAQRLNAVAPSVTLAMNARALELKARGVDVFAFGVGEPDFEPPQVVLDAAKRAIDAGSSKYTAVTGIPPLKEAICEATEKRRGWRPKAANVCVSVGAKHTLFNLAVALYDPGDEVVIPKPYWGELSGASPAPRSHADSQSTRARRMAGSSRRMPSNALSRREPKRSSCARHRTRPERPIRRLRRAASSTFFESTIAG